MLKYMIVGKAEEVAVYCKNIVEIEKQIIRLNGTLSPTLVKNFDKTLVINLND